MRKLRSTNLISNSVILLFLLSMFLFQPSCSKASEDSVSYQFQFVVDEDGDADVLIVFTHQTDGRGSSWLLLPKNLSPIIDTITGLDPEVEVESAVADGVEFYFYENYTFTYDPVDGLYNLTIGYSFSHAAFVMEPRAFFYSPQIGIPDDTSSKFLVILPQSSSIGARDVKLASRGYGRAIGVDISELSDGRVKVEGTSNSIDRIAFEYSVVKDPSIERVFLGRYQSKIVERYDDLALYFLELYQKSDPSLVDLFGVQPEDVELTLFTPTLEEFVQELQGYVPFTGREIGSIHLNIFYIRTIAGRIEVTALHELIHSFLWQVGIPPEMFWVHEGLAEYLSIEMAKLPEIGYRSSAESQERGLLALLGGNSWLGRVQKWRYEPIYYASSYYVFKTLGEKHGGLIFYRTVFDSLNDMEIHSDSDVVYALSKAAGEDLIPQFREWGFDVTSLDRLSALIGDAEESFEGMSPLLQPYQWIADSLLTAAERAKEDGDYSIAMTYANASSFVSRNGVLLMILTVISLIVLVTIIVRLRRNSRKKPIGIWYDSRQKY